MSTADAFAAAQGLLGARVFARMLRTRGGRAVPLAAPPPGAGIAAIVPVLDERARLGPCLEGLLAQGPELAGILVVDGGSTDGTQELARIYAARDARVRLVDASPVPAGWNGKAWGLATGLAASDPQTEWLVTVDADVRPGPAFAGSLLAHAVRERLDAFSAAPLLELSGAAEALVHPAFLTTLVYRYGLPGRVLRSVRRAQANGQCFVARRELLVRTRAFTAARASRCDDVTIVRKLIAAGTRVGFYEGGALATVRMYASLGDAWRNWPRSLPMRDATTPPAATALDLAEVALVQAAPLAVVLGTLALGGSTRGALFRLNLGLLAARIGVLAGTARAYARVPGTYWLSPLADAAVAARLVAALSGRTAVWRGRTLVPEGRSA